MTEWFPARMREASQPAWTDERFFGRVWTTIGHYLRIVLAVAAPAVAVAQTTAR